MTLQEVQELRDQYNGINLNVGDGPMNESQILTIIEIKYRLKDNFPSEVKKGVVQHLTLTQNAQSRHPHHYYLMELDSILQKVIAHLTTRP